MQIEGKSDQDFMKLAIQEALLAPDHDDIPIGALVVCNGKVIGRGHNQVEMLNDATAHAEMIAITSAYTYLGSRYLNECTLYVTLEPCPMCAGALNWSQLGRLVYAAPDDKRGFEKYNKEIIHPKTKLLKGVLESECSHIVKDFFKKLR
ncbi:nucleoside deaminase [Chondrinema litorale]|uniref:nucleoside deaminase n=1 Tax=Chondrinema litorale TaxID=2994555 RepID=UPI002542E4A0|nr:nucleoside deaminase [Chondrinema litorale]UZR92441.1 nucleoside deaminase [Chondrinema litorale]